MRRWELSAPRAVFSWLQMSLPETLGTSLLPCLIVGHTLRVAFYEQNLIYRSGQLYGVGALTPFTDKEKEVRLQPGFPDHKVML